MGAHLIDLSVLGSNIDEDTLVLTPNMRIQRKLLEAYQSVKEANGDVLWAAPKIFDLKSWILAEYEKWFLMGRVPSGFAMASDVQMLNLWADIIDSDPKANQIVGAGRLAKKALEATKNFALWNLDPESDPSLLVGQEECEHYAKWLTSFRLRMRKEKFISPEQAIRDMVGSIPSYPGAFDIESVVMYGFDDLAPLYQSLVNAITETGVEVVSTDAQPINTSVVRVATRQREDQIDLAARWAAQKLSENPEATIGIVCPELTEQRDVVMHRFARHLEPLALHNSMPRYTLPFNISAGVPLSDTPVIRTALDILAASDMELSRDRVESILTSPFIEGAESELSNRSRARAKIQTFTGTSLSLNDYLERVNNTPVFASAIGKYLQRVLSTPFEMRPGQWAMHFNQCLIAMGWPGERNPDSEEYQAIQMWKKQLDSLASMDNFIHQCSRGKAMELLARIVNSHVFQPEMGNSQIQFLGMLEASGLQFDHCWVIDMNDDIWPQSPEPNIFIPKLIQREHNMPHSCPNRELEYSRRILTRIIDGSKDVVLSYGEQHEERELRPSELICHAEKISSSELEVDCSESILDRYRSATACEEYTDYLSPLDDEKKSFISGGVGILDSQSRCSIQAQLRYRLKAREKHERQLGLDARERGEVVHQVVQYFWQETKTQDALFRMEAHAFEMLVHESIDHALFWIQGKRKDIGQQIIKLERDRLYLLITQWIDEVEKQRAPFKVVEVEHTKKISVNGLPITMRIDRKDELYDGTHAVLDYKTGSFNVSQWAGERPDSVQIPLHAIHEDNSSAAIIAQPRMGECKITGFAQDPDQVGCKVYALNSNRIELPQDWDDLRSKWTEDLNNLAAEFISGSAEVNPKKADSCRFCELAPVCRKDAVNGVA